MIPAVIVAGASLVLVIPVASRAEERPGNLWKTTSQMTMEGIPMPPMPATNAELCTAKVWTQPPPPPPGQTCTQTDFQRTDNKVTWKTQCTGQMDMAGEGEITFNTENSYTGLIKLVAEGVTMSINLSGTKVGECDNPVQ
jgi:autotransporter translocation and assembly factor TamB